MASRDELTEAELLNDPSIPRITVRPSDIPAPPINDMAWGAPDAAGRPSGRLFEPDQTPARKPITEVPEGWSVLREVPPEAPLPPWQGGRLREPDLTLAAQPPDPTARSRAMWERGYPSAGQGPTIGGLVAGAAVPQAPRAPGAPVDPTAVPRQMWQQDYPSPQQPSLLQRGVTEGLDQIERLGESQQIQFSPGATPEQRERARRQAPEQAADVSMNVAGLGMTGASIRGGSSLGVFGGRIEPGRKAYAERLELEGVTPNEIWKKAGLVRFADKQWRQEIPDLAASYRGDVDSIASRIFDQKYPDLTGQYRKSQIDVRSQIAKQEAALKIQQGNLVLDDVIPHHPILYELYPELRQMPVSRDAIMEASGGYYRRSKEDPSGRIVYREEADKSGKVTPRGLTFKTLIHEIDHAIANIEGFAKGSNAQISNVDIAGSPARQAFDKAIAQIPQNLWTSQVIAQTRERAAHGAYNASAGEKSATAAEMRTDFTPEQLAAINPTSMMRPRLDKQVVEYNPRFDPSAPQAQMGSTSNLTPVEMQASSHGLMPPKSQRKAQGSFNPLDEMDVTWKGKPMAQWKPQDWKEVGDHYGVKNLGPLSKVERYLSPDGYVFEIPGGTKGTWTYYDLLHMKANPINPNNLPHELHAEMQKKLGRTMTPHGEVGQDQIWNGLMFGMTSSSNPLFPNQLSMSRLRLRDPKMLDDLANAIPWEAGATHTRDGQLITKDMRNAIDIRIGEMFNLHEGMSAGSTGLGTRGSVNYTYISELAQMFRKNPEWFRKKTDEDWTSFVERLATQTKGLSMKTGSFGSVWQDPYMAAISAIDRHMAKEFERRGGLFLNQAEQDAWQSKTLASWNKELPADQRIGSWRDLTQQRGFEGFMSEKLLEYVGSHSKKDFRNVKGEINPRLPSHLAKEKWFYEPKQALQAGPAYRRALAENQKAANEQGLNLFMSQWFEWDRIRQRFEPHENMFPGLSLLPAPSARQLKIPFAAHVETGHKSYDYGPTGRMNPTKKFPRNPSEMGYLGVPLTAGAGAAGIGSVVDQKGYQEDAR